MKMMKRLAFLIPLVFLFGCAGQKGVQEQITALQQEVEALKSTNSFFGGIDFSRTGAGLGLSTWTAQTDGIASGDLLGITDISDTTESSDGTSKKITGSQLQDFWEGATNAWTGTNTFTGTVNLPTLDELIFDERADHVSTPAAAKGYLWVKSDTPSSLIFTDDAGTDVDLTASAAQSPWSSDINTANYELTNTTGTGSVVVELNSSDGSDYFEVEDSADATLFSVDSNGNGTFTGTLQGYAKVTNKTADATLTDAEMNGIIFVDPTATATMTLPAVETGQTVCVYGKDSNEIRVDPNASDRIVLEGTAMTDGEYIKSDSTAGSFVCLIGDSASGWTTLGISGTWTQETP